MARSVLPSLARKLEVQEPGNQTAGSTNTARAVPSRRTPKLTQVPNTVSARRPTSTSEPGAIQACSKPSSS